MLGKVTPTKLECLTIKLRASKIQNFNIHFSQNMIFGLRSLHRDVVSDTVSDLTINITVFFHVT